MDRRLEEYLESMSTAVPWIDGNTIPWDDPAFSARMLKEHLSQLHDAASRRSATIDAHVAWLHDYLLRGVPASVLDLGCGPGLYCQRLAQLGCDCTGIDFSPASIAYARSEADRVGLSINFVLADMRAVSFGAGRDLAMLIFGEASVFPSDELLDIFRRSAAALTPSGRLVVETHTFDGVRDMATPAVHEFSLQNGLWSDRSHHGVRQSNWDVERSTVTQRYVILDDETGEIIVSTASYQARTDSHYRALLLAAGFQDVQCCLSLAGPDDAGQAGLVVYVASL